MTSEADLQYLPTLTVPHVEKVFEQWELNSRSARTNLPPTELRYGPDGHEVADVFEPTRGGVRATVVFIHGGYWRSFYKDSFSYLAPELVKDKCRVIIPSHGLAPAYSLTRIVDQIRRCVSTVAERYDEPLVLAGHSAGGQLVAMMYATDWDAHPDLTRPRITAGITLSGLFDLEPLRHTSLQQTVAITDDESATLSPLRLHPTTPAPLHTVVGELESAVFHQQSSDLVQAWGSQLSGPRSMPGHNHVTVCDELPRLVAEVLNR